MEQYLRDSFFYNYHSPEFLEFIHQMDISENNTPEQTAIALYYRVRDGWKYNPYQLHFKKESWQASEIIQRKMGHCLDKSIILITCLRYYHIPARIHLAKVRNHIGVEKIIEKFSRDELTPHGYVEVFLHNKWVACTPAFNLALCNKLNVAPLEFDGIHDSVFQAFDKTGKRFMEYLEDYGTFEDFPLNFVYANLKEHYEELTELIEQGHSWNYPSE